MQGSSSTHTQAKRSSIALEPPLIAGIVVVVAAFNLILAVSWCIMRDRKKVNKLHKPRISAPVDCEKYEHSVAFAITTGVVPHAVPSPVKNGGQAEQGGKTYYELIRALQAQPNPPTPPAPARHSRRPSQNSIEATGISKFVLRPQDMKELNGVPVYPKTKRDSRLHVARQSLGVPGRADLRRANSLTDTASVYSSASAPIEYHEQLFHQPFALDSAAPNSAPAWISQMPKPPSPAILSDASTASFEISLSSPTASTLSERSDASTIVPAKASPISVSPISIPASSTPSPARSRSRANSSSSAMPPKIRWLTKAATQTPPAPARARRPSSVSSLSTILSFSGAAAAAAPAVVAPLNIRRQSTDAPWQSVDLTRSTPLSPRGPRPATAPALAPPPPPVPVPVIPARSPRRPPPSTSVEHLPM